MMLATIPKGLPNIADARLPEVYERAKETLQNCVSVDECKDWADKAEALASYARQAGDQELRKMADRIQARAINRCGELLRAIPKASGGNQAKSNGAVTFGRDRAATDAGLSKRQKDTAMRVRNISPDEFEELVDSDDPPSVTKLAEMGTKKRLIDLGNRSPEEFKQATALIGLIDHILRHGKTINVSLALRGCDKFEKQELIANVGLAIEWLATLEKTAR